MLLFIYGYLNLTWCCIICTCMQFLNELKQNVLKSASVHETRFYARLELFQRGHSTATYHRHMQYEHAKKVHTFTHNDNNHHSPISSEQYIEFRVRPTVQFYQSRLPGYWYSHSTTTILVMLSSLVGTVLTFARLPQWTTVSAIIASSLTAWAAFHGTEKKLNRYSKLIDSIANLMLWWRSLPDVERSGQGNIDTLVATAEDLFQEERQAWLSTSNAAKRLADGSSARQQAIDDEFDPDCSTKKQD